MVKDQDIQLEAKDYKSKNGLGKICELKGRLYDLPVDSAVYAAKQYTKPARKFAKSTFDISDKKGITLLDIRKSVNKDLIGRIGTIVLKVSCPPHPEMDKISWYLSLSFATTNLIKRDGIDIQSEKNILIVDEDGCNREMIHEFEKEILNSIMGMPLNDGDVFKGYLRDRKLCARLSNGKKYPIDYFYYEVPICVIYEEIEVTSNGNPVIYIKSDDGAINKLITDVELLKWGKQNGITQCSEKD